jgi:hypothetical protein
MTLRDILLPEGHGMERSIFIARLLQAAIPAMRTRDLQIRIRQPVIVPNVMLMQAVHGWEQPLITYRLLYHARCAMRMTVLHPNIRRPRTVLAVTVIPAEAGRIECW